MDLIDMNDMDNTENDGNIIDISEQRDESEEVVVIGEKTIGAIHSLTHNKCKFQLSDKCLNIGSDFDFGFRPKCSSNG